MIITYAFDLPSPLVSSLLLPYWESTQNGNTFMIITYAFDLPSPLVSSLLLPYWESTQNGNTFMKLPMLLIYRHL